MGVCLIWRKSFPDYMLGVFAFLATLVERIPNKTVMRRIWEFFIVDVYKVSNIISNQQPESYNHKLNFNTKFQT